MQSSLPSLKDGALLAASPSSWSPSSASQASDQRGGTTGASTQSPSASLPLSGTQMAHRQENWPGREAKRLDRGGSSSLGQSIDFVFRHTKYPITVTVVTNLIFESLFMGHLG